MLASSTHFKINKQDVQEMDLSRKVENNKTQTPIYNSRVNPDTDISYNK